MDNQEALNDAAEHGKIEDVKKYLKDDTVNVNCTTNGFGWAALHYACNYGHLEIAELLLDHGANIEVRGIDRHDTPLSVASYQGHLSITNFLLDRGANINVCNKYGCNPLHGACESGQESTAKLLLDRGCAINAADEDGDTPLHRACDEGYSDCVAELLAHEADGTIQNKHGDTPLHRACYNGLKTCVQELLVHGADGNIKNNDGQTPMDVAASTKKQSSIIDLFNSERKPHFVFTSIKSVHRMQKNGDIIERFSSKNQSHKLSIFCPQGSRPYLIGHYGTRESVRGLMSIAALCHKSRHDTVVTHLKDWANRGDRPIKRVFYFRFPTALAANMFANVFNEVLSDFEKNRKADAAELDEDEVDEDELYSETQPPIDAEFPCLSLE